MASTTEEPTGEIQEEPDVVTHTLRYKTWVLGVSMRCASCGNKVTKVLNVIDGVYITRVNIAQQKVTVGGDVKVETLITELYKKTNKRAELLWPSDPDHYEREDNNKPKEDDGDQAAAVPEEPKANHAGGGGGGDKKKKGKEPVKEEVVEVGPVASGGSGAKKNFEVGSSSKGGGSAEVEGSVVKPNGGGAAAGGGGGGGGKGKEAVTGNSPSQSPPVVVEKKSDGVEIGDGGSKNKKGGKGQDGNENVAEGSEGGGVAPPAQPVLPPKAQPVPQTKPYGPPSYVLGPAQAPAPAHYGPPPQQQQQVYKDPYLAREHPQQYEQYPPYMRGQEQHFANVHAMDYNAAHPGISFGAARYAVPSASTQARTYAQWEVEVPGTPLDNPSLPQPPTLAPLPYPPHPYYYSGYYSFFSDENHNACSVM